MPNYDPYAFDFQDEWFNDYYSEWLAALDVAREEREGRMAAEQRATLAEQRWHSALDKAEAVQRELDALKSALATVGATMGVLYQGRV